MTVIFYLLIVSLTIAACGLGVFLWSLKSGQYDDLEGAARRILFDDVPAPSSTKPKQVNRVKEGKYRELP